MKVDLGIWDRLARLIVFLLILAALLGVAYSYVPGMRMNEARRLELHQRQAELRLELERSNVLKAQIDALRTDGRTLERYYRETMNYARSNEVVIRFVPASPAASAQLKR